MKYSRIILFYVIAAVMTVYVRTAQLLYLTEAESGFFYADSRAIAAVLSLFMVIATSVSVGLSTQTRRTAQGAPKKSIPLSVAALLLSGATLYDVLFVEYVTNQTLFVMLTDLFGILSSMALLLFAVRPFVKMLDKIHKLFYIVLPLYFMFKLITVFTVYATVSVIAANVVTLLFLCAALLFFLFMLKLESGIAAGRSACALFPISIAASIISACAFIPQIVVLAAEKPELIHDDPQGIVLAAGFTVFCCTYMFALFSKKNIIKNHRGTKRLAVDTTYTEMSSQFVSFVPRDSHDIDD